MARLPPQRQSAAINDFWNSGGGGTHGCHVELFPHRGSFRFQATWDGHSLPLDEEDSLHIVLVLASGDSLALWLIFGHSHPLRFVLR